MFRFWTSRTRPDPSLLKLCAWPLSIRQGVNIHSSQATKCLQRAHHVGPSTQQRQTTRIALPATKCVLVKAISRAFRNRTHSLHCYRTHGKQTNLQNRRHYSQGREAEPMKVGSAEYHRVWRAANREKTYGFYQKWRAKNPERWQEIQDRTREKNKAKHQAYYKEIVYCKECNHACARNNMHTHSESSGHQVSDRHTHQCHECKRWFAKRGFLVRHGTLKGHTVDPQPSSEQKD
jgi:hypothetical protein